MYPLSIYGRYCCSCNRRGVIGKEGSIPWNITEDLHRFRGLTENHIVVMGRKTYESIPNAPLKKRCNIVITSVPEQYTNKPDRLIFTTMEDVQTVIEEQQCTWGNKVFVIGGEAIYKHFFSQCKDIHLTMVENMIEGDVYFPIEIADLTTKHGFVQKLGGHRVLSTTDVSTFQFLHYAK